MRHVAQGLGRFEGVRLGLDLARPGDQHDRELVAYFYVEDTDDTSLGACFWANLRHGGLVF
jgi:hypothetical protein